jgi:hypothetical protein
MKTLTAYLLMILLLLSQSCWAGEEKTLEVLSMHDMTTYTPSCSVTLMGKDYKEARIDFCGDKVKFSGDLPVGEAAKIFFEYVFREFQSNNQLLLELKHCQDRSMKILSINNDCINSLEKCANYLQKGKP